MQNSVKWPSHSRGCNFFSLAADDGVTLDLERGCMLGEIRANFDMDYNIYVSSTPKTSQSGCLAFIKGLQDVKEADEIRRQRQEEQEE